MKKQEQQTTSYSKNNKDSFPKQKSGGKRGKEDQGNSSNESSSNMTSSHNNRHFKQRPILYPAESDNYDILYSEEGDGEILVEKSPDQKELQLITCIDISTLYKEKRTKAIDIAKEFQKLQHPNLLSILEEFKLLDNSGTLLFKTEAPDHIAGWKSYCKKKFTTEEMLCIFKQLCRGLSYMHEKGLVHRDVHPTRIHSSKGLMKFNMIGMPYNYKKLLKKDNFCGHVNYSAPELILEKVNFTPKVDVWSLGCCLYYLCTKKDPFEGRSPQEIKQNVMSGKLERYPTKIEPILKTLINKCLEKDENNRLDANQMMEFQDQVETSHFGEIISTKLIQQSHEQYIISCDDKSRNFDKNQQAEMFQASQNFQKYQNPQFFYGRNYQFNYDQGYQGYEEQSPAPHKINYDYYDEKGSYAGSQNRSGTGGHQQYLDQQYSSHATSNYQSNSQPSRKTQLSQNYAQYKQYNKKSGEESNYGAYTRGRGISSNQSQQQSNNQKNFNNQMKVQNDQIEQQYHNYNKQNQRQFEQSIDKRTESIIQNNNQNTVKESPSDLKVQELHLDNDQKQLNQSPIQSTPESQQTQNHYNLTQTNLSKFNEQFKEQDTQKQDNKTQSQNQKQQNPSNNQVIEREEINQNLNAQVINTNDDQAAIPDSIFSNDFFKFERNSNSEIVTDCNEYNSDPNKESNVTQENPSSNESRNDPNKDEIENIVVQMVDVSQRVKNQLHYFDGTKYVGEVMRHGSGMYYDQDGSIYDGEWYEDQKSGRGKMLFPDGSFYDGQWSGDKMHGQGIYISSTRDRFEGSFSYGLKVGYGTMQYYNGNSFSGQWRNDQIQGKGQFVFKNGNHYDGNFMNGLFEGYGTMLFVGIGTYKGMFIAGNLNGQGRFEYLDSSIYEGNWKENKKFGTGQMVESDGVSVYNGEWLNDQKHGKGIFLQKGNCLIEGVWTQGVLTEMIQFKYLQ
ncbi:phosphatidylinositol-4-phosphate 5- [Stylonychia lemnae]|uniref:Phosphatidylinositol-4-phosphate 5 n=1 Tax=Stylonychia lemnae TaxID=5949 RepID=A0A077ZZT1_STYLE|nr:phosphatidylinositol-4-phosphate 5- [Stylonychia lemnae]|eukprot:CDW74718.1 phosphatidylinositol-4-phosphate 5- [Stylonychia lemnae]